jgi:hypothetical protein
MVVPRAGEEGELGADDTADIVSHPPECCEEELELRGLCPVRDVDCFVFQAKCGVDEGAGNGEVADLTLGGLFAQTECALVARGAEVGEEAFPAGDAGLRSGGNEV